MSMKIKRIIEDLADEDIDIQILALTTIPRLSVDSVLVHEELAELKGMVDKARQSENSDIVFLARKAANYLGELSTQVEEARSKALDGDVAKEEAVPTDGAGDSVADEVSADETPADSPAVAEEDAAVQAGASPEAAAAASPAQAEAPEAAGLSPEAEATLEETLETLTSSDDAKTQATALATLRQVGNKACLPQVVPFLKEADARVRSNAIEVIEEFGGKEHIPHLIPHIKDPDNRVRSNTIKALGRFGHPQVRFFLKQMLGHEEVRMRESAVYAMDQLREQIDVLDLLIYASQDNYDGIRLRAVTSLGSYDLPEAVEALKKHVVDDDDKVRQAACRVLSSKGADVEKLLNKELERTREPDRKVVDNTLPEGEAETDDSALLKAKVEAAEGNIFNAVVDRIAKGLALQERRARVSLLLFDVGIKGYKGCRTGVCREKSLMVSYYEIVRYQESLTKLADRLRSQAGENASILKAGIEQYHGKIRDCFIKLGKQTADLVKKEKVQIDAGDQIEALDAYLGKAEGA